MKEDESLETKVQITKGWTKRRIENAWGRKGILLGTILHRNQEEKHEDGGDYKPIHTPVMSFLTTIIYFVIFSMLD